MVFLNLLILWTNTTIQVPVFDSLEQYKYLPEATLYVDGKEVTDSLMYYQMEVDRTFFSVVNTAITETYIVKYRVFYPTYQVQSTEVIYFEVVDNIPPEIIYFPNYKFPVGSKNIDLTSGIKLKDNYDGEELLSLTVLNQNDINTSVPGHYEIVYEVKDLSNNIVIYHHSVIIYDNIAPSITQTNKVELSIGSKLNYQNYFKISDNITEVLKVAIDDSKVNYNIAGNYIASISAEDQSGNITSYSFTIYVVDNSPPEIILKSSTIKIKLDDVKDRKFYQDYIITVFDNTTSLKASDVIIYDYVAYNMIGHYEVTYELSDLSHNKAVKTLKVEIVDLTPPTIKLIKPLTIDVNTLYINFLDYFKIEDNWTPHSQLKITYKHTLDLTKLGKYIINVSVVDQFSNTTNETHILEVRDLIPPVIEVSDFITLNNIDEIDRHITVSDNYDLTKNIKISFDLSNFNNNKPGTYLVIISATDLSNNESKKEVLVEIKDLIPPLIKTSKNFYSLSYEDDLIIIDDILLALNLTITDNYTTSNLIQISYENNLNKGVVGSYDLIITATDLNENISSKTIKLIVEDKKPPEITNLKTFEFNNPVSLSTIESELTIKDYSNNINIIWDRRTQLLNKPGIYHLPLILGDEYGNYTNYLITIKINKKPIYHSLLFWLSTSITTISITSIIIYDLYMRKKSNRFDN